MHACNIHILLMSGNAAVTLEKPSSVSTGVSSRVPTTHHAKLLYFTKYFKMYLNAS